MGFLSKAWGGVKDIFSNPVQLVTIAVAISTGNWWYVAAAVSTAAYGNYQTKRMEEKAKAAYNNSLQDRLTNALTAEEPYQVIYGEAKVGGAITAVLKSGNKDQYRHIVMVHAAHEVQEINQIYINGTALGTLDSNGNVTSGKYFKGDSSQLTDTFTVDDATYTLSNTPNVDGITAVIDQGENGYASFGIVSVVGNVVTLSSDILSYIGQSVQIRYTSPTTGTSYVRVKKHLGTATDAADASLISECPDYWTSDHLLRGFAYTVVRIDLNFEEFQSGLPQVHALIKGKKLFDPRTSTTAWSDNPALCIYDYLTSSYGANQPSSALVLSTFNTAANACDETIGVGKRYTCNGSFKTDQDPKQILDSLADSMVGFISQSGGWMIHAGVYTAPVLDLTEEDTVGGIQMSPAPALNDVFNTVTGQYSNPDKDYLVTDYQPYKNSSYASADGRELPIDYTLLFTNSNQRCQNIARIVTERAREALTIKVKFTLKAWPLQCGDRVTYTNSAYGWDQKVFRVVEWNFSPDQPVELVLQEDGSTIYDEADAVITDEFPNTDLPDQFLIGAPVGLVVTPQRTVNTDGTIQSSINVRWDSPTIGTATQYEVQWYQGASPPVDDTEFSSAFVTTNEYTILNVIPDNIYYIKVRAYNFQGIKSAWTYDNTLSVGDKTPPGLPTSVTATAAKQSIVLTWVNPTDDDFNTVEIWVNTSATTFGASKLTEVRSERFTHDNLGSLVTRYYYLKAKDTSGNTSAFTSVVSATTERNLADQIADDIITTAAFAQGITPVEVVDVLPSTNNFAGRTVVLTTDNKLYRYRADTQLTVVGSTTQSFGSSTSGSITLPTSLQNDLVIVAIGSDGSLANVPSGWTSINGTTNGTEFARTIYKVMGAVPDTSVAITGISTASVAIAVSLRGSDTSAIFDATAVVTTGTTGMPNCGSITTVNNNALAIAIGYLDDDNVQSSVTAPAGYSNLVAIQSSTAGQTVMLATKNVSTYGLEDAAAFGGTGTDEWVGVKLAIRPALAWTAAVPTVDLTGQITNTQISDNSISTPKLQANAITAEKISSNAITTDKLDANSITAAKIAAGAIGADQIAANAISADKIAADAVTADKILVADLSAISANLGTLTAGTINTGAGVSLSMGTDGNGSVFRLERDEPTLLPPAYLIDYSLRGAPTTMWIDSLGYPEGTSTGSLEVDYVTLADFGLSGLSVPVSGSLSTGAVINLTITDGDIVLVKHQTIKSENGIYVASSGAWSRLTGYTTRADMLNRSYFVRSSSSFDATCNYYLVPTAIENTFARYNKLDSSLFVVVATLDHITLSGTQTIDGYALSVGNRVLVKNQTNNNLSSCVAATTANITLSGTQTIDGVAVVAGNRVLVKNQTTQSQNGIYVVASGAWTRATDADSWAELYQATTAITSGTVNNGTRWYSQTVSSGTLGTTAITFTSTRPSSTAHPSNGIYVVASGSWTRATGATNATGLYSSEYFVSNGSINLNKYFIAISGLGTIGSIDVEFVENFGVGVNWIGESIFLTSNGSEAINIQDYWIVADNPLLSIDGARKEAQLSVTSYGSGYSAHAGRFAHNTRVPLSSFADSGGVVNSSAICATEGGSAFYAETGNYAPFTGTHDGLLSKLENVEIGDILVDYELVIKKDLSNTLFKVKKASIPNKNSIGVLCSVEDLKESDPPASLIDRFESVKVTDQMGKESLVTKLIPNEMTKELAEDYLLVNINAIGEGQVNVCGENGNIQAGDLIVTSSIPGKGMKQSDDIIRSYTVAKSRESVTFSSPNEIKMIACIYLCG
jgi:hypothetical protein